MSSAKFYVLGGGRWRELDTSAGRVEGWGGARFLYVERGRLRSVRRAPVLRGLRALAAGRPRAVCDGAPLSQIRHIKAVKEKRLPCERHTHCQHAFYGCGVNAQFNMQLQPVRAVHAGVQADLSHDLCHDEFPALPPQGEKSRGPIRNIANKSLNNKIQKKMIVRNKQREIIMPHQNNGRLNSSDEDLSASIMEWNRKRKLREIRSAELCKELIIAEEDIMLLRNYIEKDEKNLFNVDLEKFDADDTYKSKVFYKLNPLVNVERCKAIADMTWEQQSQSTVTLKDFITNLGLRRVDDPSFSRTNYRMRKRRDARNPRESLSDQDKENLSWKRQPKVKKRPNKVLGESVGGKPNSDKVKGKVKSSEVPSRATRGSRRLEESVVVEVSDSDDAFERTEPAARRKRAGGGREYSPAEDAAIVRWVQAAGRAHLVNGNRLWRELQPEHQRLTGHCRGTRCATATCATCCRRWARCCRRPPPPPCAPPPPAERSRRVLRRDRTRCWRHHPYTARGHAGPALRPPTPASPTPASPTEHAETYDSRMYRNRLARCDPVACRPRRRSPTRPRTRNSQGDSWNDIVPRPTRTRRTSPNPKRLNDALLKGYVQSETPTPLFDSTTYRADTMIRPAVEPRIQIMTSPTLPENVPLDPADKSTNLAEQQHFRTLQIDTPTTGARRPTPPNVANIAHVVSTILIFNNYVYFLKKVNIKNCCLWKMYWF